MFRQEFYLYNCFPFLTIILSTRTEKNAKTIQQTYSQLADYDLWHSHYRKT